MCAGCIALLASVFLFNDAATAELFTLSLHDALPISYAFLPFGSGPRMCIGATLATQTLMTTLPSVLRRYRLARSEEHTSELQSRRDLVCRLLLEKKKHRKQNKTDRQKDDRTPAGAQT